jgi:hypothetical protein
LRKTAHSRQEIGMNDAGCRRNDDAAVLRAHIVPDPVKPPPEMPPPPAPLDDPPPDVEDPPPIVPPAPVRDPPASPPRPLN